jgi:O-antigen ligase
MVVVVSVGVMMPQQYQDRFMTIFHVGAHDKNGAGESAYGRINGFILGWKFFLHNPLTGVGIGNFGLWHHREPGGDWTDAHNLIGKLVGETGILGIVTFFWFILRFARTIKSTRRAYWDSDWGPDYVYYLSEAVKIGLIMLFVQGIFGHNLYRDNWYFFAAFMVTAAKFISERQQAEAIEEAETVPAIEARPQE